jgi:receptor expression-enhancing protein 5/6
MDAVKAQVKTKTAIFDNIGNKIPPLADAAKNLDLNSGTFVAIGLAVFSLFMLIFHGIEIAITTYTILYPGVCSIKAIESKESDDDKHWLTYWMMVGALDVVETFFGFIFYFVPYWGYLRLGIFVWLISFNGASTIFAMVQPLLHEHRDHIQQFCGMFSEKLAEGAADLKNQATDPSNMMKAAGMVAQAQHAAQVSPLLEAQD